VVGRSEIDAVADTVGYAVTDPELDVVSVAEADTEFVGDMVCVKVAELDGELEGVSGGVTLGVPV
jgi:hypothetical protein